jgi:hypothetical protein
MRESGISFERDASIEGFSDFTTSAERCDAFWNGFDRHRLLSK